MRRVLIVEDNPDLLSLLNELLSVDYDVSTARTGEDAVRIAERVRPELIILDLQLPVMDGMEAGRCIKRARAPEQVPVLALTALASQGDDEMILNCGCCDEYMSKPASLAAIKKRVEHMLARVDGAVEAGSSVTD